METRDDAGTLGAIGDTPLVELPSARPTDGAPVYAKWEGANPTGSVKDRMALAMIRAAERRGDLAPGQPVVEATGGSTGASLGLVCAVTDHPLYLVTANCYSTEKLASMRALGADLEVVETPSGSSYEGLYDDMRTRAEAIASRTGAYFTDQFHNEDQLRGYDALGAEILAQCESVAAFVMTVGTGGCSMGVAAALAERRPDVEVTVVEPAESPVVSEGQAGTHDVEGTATLGAPPLVEPALYDRVATVPEADGKRRAAELARREGLLAGTSTGLNVAAASRVAADHDEGDAVVTVACDTGLKYVSGRTREA
jgi:cysteine synthase A